MAWDEMACVEPNAPRDVVPERANVAFAASITAMALRDAINAGYILWVMVRTGLLVAEQPSSAR